MSEEEIQPPDDGEDSPFQTEKKPKRRLESSYYSVVSRTAADGRILIGQDVEIYPDRECPAFASPGTKAYEAKDRLLPGEQFVLTCGRSAVPRVTVIGSYKDLRNPHIMRLIDAGIVNWTPENRQRFALVFEKPLGKKILESQDAEIYRISEDKLIQAVIEPAIRVLSDFSDVDLVHGAINAENIYLTGGAGGERALLGECLSSAPSWRQHPIYEVSARAVAQPSGRGSGTIMDDLYALGVCVAMLARGENLLRRKTPQEVIAEKMEHGSYGMIIGRERLPGGIAEFLRGVLNDDEEQRWNIGAARHWLEGRRLSPKQSRVVLKAARPLTFHEDKYWDLRALAQAFSEHTREAAAEIEKGQFEVWLRRNFEDKALATRFDRLWAKEEKEKDLSQLVSSICMALDPLGPVRYKGLAVFPAGFGMALAHAIAKGEDIQVYGELIAQQLFNDWVNQMFDDIPDATGLLSLLEKCRSALTQRMPGYGIERVLYMMNMEVACLSPVLQNYFVLTPGGLLLALEDISKQPNRPEVLLDRHMVAFISVREPKMIDSHLGYVNAAAKGPQMIGMIRTLAAIQRRFSTGLVPGVSAWLTSLTGPVIELLNDRDLRVEVSKHVNALKDSGNLAALLELLDNPLLTREDMQRFLHARQEFKMLVAEKIQIEGYIKKRKNFGMATGRQISMLLSAILSTIAIAAYVMLRLTH